MIQRVNIASASHQSRDRKSPSIRAFRACKTQARYVCIFDPFRFLQDRRYGLVASMSNNELLTENNKTVTAS